MFDLFSYLLVNPKVSYHQITNLTNYLYHFSLTEQIKLLDILKMRENNLGEGERQKKGYYIALVRELEEKLYSG